MVTKHLHISFVILNCSVLAKILMVTKRSEEVVNLRVSSVLAKILMVTKPLFSPIIGHTRSVLAKILMVTKLKKQLKY